MFENLALRGLLSLMGAFLISLAVGVNFLWGIITIYGTSYFRLASKDSTITENQTDIVFPLMLLGQAISFPVIARYAKKVSAGMTCFVAGIAMSFIMYFASYAQNYPNFALVYGLGNGIVIGVIYILPIGHCYQFFPKKKTTISIFIIAASGIGTVIFAMIGVSTMNPDNLSLQQAGHNLYYGRQIAQKFPDYLKILSGVTLGFVSGGGLLLFEYPTKLESSLKKELLQSEMKQKNMVNLMDLQFVLNMDDTKEVQSNPFGNLSYDLMDMGQNYDRKSGKVYGEKGDHLFWAALEESQYQYAPQKEGKEPNNEVKKSQENAKNQIIPEEVNQCPRTSDGPRECIFWILFLVIILGANFGLMISVNYKTYVKAEIKNDQYLTLIGAIGALACSLSRILWGSILDKQTFKAIYYSLSILNAILAFSISFISSIKEIYFFYVILSYICYGGHLGIFPAVTSQIFGVRYGPQIYGILFYAFPVSNFIQFLIVNYIDKGYEVIFQVSGVMSICALFLVKRIQLNYDWSARIREHNERKRMLAR